MQPDVVDVVPAHGRGGGMKKILRALSDLNHSDSVKRVCLPEVFFFLN